VSLKAFRKNWLRLRVNAPQIRIRKAPDGGRYTVSDK
jgi:hypothetical protein